MQAEPQSPHTASAMTAEDIEALFRRADGSFAFARWGRPLAPVVFGVQAQTLGTIKGAIEALCTLAEHQMAETDPQLGSNFMWFFCRDWEELGQVPGLDGLVAGLPKLLAKLKAAEANQYRLFRFDAEGAIMACFLFLRMDEQLRAVSAQALALAQAAQSMLLWSDLAFREQAPLVTAGQNTILRPEIGAVIRASYDPVLPASGSDASLALRLFARMGALQ